MTPAEALEALDAAIRQYAEAAEEGAGVCTSWIAVAHLHSFVGGDSMERVMIAAIPDQPSHVSIGLLDLANHRLKSVWAAPMFLDEEEAGDEE